MNLACPIQLVLSLPARARRRLVVVGAADTWEAPLVQVPPAKAPVRMMRMLMLRHLPQLQVGVTSGAMMAMLVLWTQVGLTPTPVAVTTWTRTTMTSFWR